MRRGVFVYIKLGAVMGLLRVTVALVFCSVAVPVFAAEKGNSRVVAAGLGVEDDADFSSQAEDGIPSNVDGTPLGIKNKADLSKAKLDKKAYLKQIEDEFDKVGVADDSPYPMSLGKQTTSGNMEPASEDSVVGIPPVNAGDLIQE